VSKAPQAAVLFDARQFLQVCSRTPFMAYQFFDHTGDIGVSLWGRTLAELFGSAAEAFSDSITPIDGIEPRRPEELDVAAPELELLLVDFLSELLYRFDTRAWLTRATQIDVRERDGGWELQGTLVGEKHDPARHPVRVLIKAITYHQLTVARTGERWEARVVFDI
jgi:SHS2 domain-containing protein